MVGEVDHRLVGFLQGAIGFLDALRDVGARGEVAVSLSRDSGLQLLQLVAGARDEKAEAWSQRNRPHKDGVNSLNVAGLTFEWPKPAMVMEPDNDNGDTSDGFRRYGFDEETPALR